MYRKFSEYKSHREECELFCKFDNICENIVNSGISFDEFWLKQGMPILLEDIATTPEEALELMLEAWWNPMSWGSGGRNPSAPAAPAANPKISPVDASPKDQALLKKAGNIIIPVKQSFAKAIDSFKREIQQQAMNNPNQHHMWQVANLLSKGAQKWLQGWQPNVRRAGDGGPSYKGDYQGAYKGHQAKQRHGELARAEAERQQRTSPAGVEQRIGDVTGFGAKGGDSEARRKKYARQQGMGVGDINKVQGAVGSRGVLPSRLQGVKDARAQMAPSVDPTQGAGDVGTNPLLGRKRRPKKVTTDIA